MPNEPGVPAHLVGRDDGIETMSDVEMVDPKTGQRVTFGEWRAGQLREAEASQKLAAALKAQEAEPQEIIPRGRTVLGGGATTRAAAPVSGSAVDAHLAKYTGSANPAVQARVMRGKALVEEAWHDKDSELHRKLSLPIGSPGRDEQFDLYVAALKDKYGVETDSGLFDRQGPVSQAEVLEAQARVAPDPTRREFGPDHQMPVVHTAAGPVQLDEAVYYKLHDYAADQGIPQDITDMLIKGQILSPLANRAPAASFAELEGLWGPATEARYKTSFANATRAVEAFAKTLTSDQRAAIEPYLKNPPATIWGLFATLGESPAERGRGLEHAHTSQAGRF